MIKNPVTIAVAGALAVLTTIVATALSPASASSAFQASAGYFPDDFVNQAKDIQPAIDTYGDTGLPKSFPKESVDSMVDAAPQMYS